MTNIRILLLSAVLVFTGCCCTTIEGSSATSSRSAASAKIRTNKHKETQQQQQNYTSYSSSFYNDLSATKTKTKTKPFRQLPSMLTKTSSSLYGIDATTDTSLSLPPPQLTYKYKYGTLDSSIVNNDDDKLAPSSPLSSSSSLSLSPKKKKMSINITPLSKSNFVMCVSFLHGVTVATCKNRYGCNANMMTGNCYHLLSSLTDLRWKDASWYGTIALSYIVGMASFRLADLFATAMAEHQKRNHNHDHEHAVIEKQQQQSKATRKDLGAFSNGKFVAIVAPAVIILFWLAEMSAQFTLFSKGGTEIPSLLSSPQSIITTAVIGTTTMAVETKTTRAMHTPIMAIGFGLINAASSDGTGGLVMHALTGHLGKIGKSIVDYFYYRYNCNMFYKKNVNIEENTNNDKDKEKFTKSAQAIKSSSKVIMWYFLGIVSTLVLSNIFDNTAGRQSPLFSGLLGTLYGIIFAWYGWSSLSDHLFNK